MSVIACPVCHGETSVTETRDAPSGLRRRRRCANRSCEGRLTTFEVPMPATMRRIDARMVLVPIATLDMLAELVATMRPKAEP